MDYTVPMKVARAIVAFIGTLALAISFLVAGLAVCIQPPITHALSSIFADDAVSPFSRAQLVQVADATREFSFGNHDELELYQVIYDVDSEYLKTITSAGGTTPASFPHLELARSSKTLATMKSVFNGASDMYCYSPNTVSHLDDCYKLMTMAFPVAIIVAAIALVGLVFLGVTGRKRWVGGTLMAAGILIVVAFVGLGIWAIVDFAGLFNMFHQLFFSQGNWQFAYDSLLICALPTPFWMGMGVICLGVAIIISALAIAIGAAVRS